MSEAPAVTPARGAPPHDVPRGVERATRLAHVGELAAARQALVAEPRAPASDETFRELTDPARRLPQPYRPMPPDVLQFVPETPVALAGSAVFTNLRRARKAAAPGPGGHTAEILRLVLDDEDASGLFCEVANLLARAQVPDAIVAGLAMGRLVAIRKPAGGTRGLVVGDLLRRLVARTLAQQLSDDFEAACHPHQYALSTRAGGEALAHTLQARTQADPRLAVLSIDVSAAYDLVSREAMLASLRGVPGASPFLPTLVCTRVLLCVASRRSLLPCCPNGGGASRATLGCLPCSPSR